MDYKKLEQIAERISKMPPENQKLYWAFVAQNLDLMKFWVGILMFNALVAITQLFIPGLPSPLLHILINATCIIGLTIVVLLGSDWQKHRLLRRAERAKITNLLEVKK